jgi:hypothetical protein
MAARRPSDADREHFRRIAEANAEDPEASPPATLDEMFERLTVLRRALGPWAAAGIEGEDPSELEAHLRVMRRLRRQDDDGTGLG